MAETEKGAVPRPDVTAVFVEEQGDAAQVARVASRVAMSGPYGEVFLRVLPLPKAIPEAPGLVRVELYDGQGRPCVDPGFVSALSSAAERKAVFVHHNRAAGQALVHGFVSGKELEGWMGAPEQVDDKVREALGRTLVEIATDDGSYRGVGVAPSATVALVRGRALAVPVGLPTMMGSFAFHSGQPPAAEGAADPVADPEGGGQVVLLAWDEELVEKAWNEIPGQTLAAAIGALPERLAGPLSPVRGEVAAELAALGEQSPGAAGCTSVRARELVTLSQALCYTASEKIAFLDERLMPVFFLGSGDPVMDDPDEAEELEALPSVLAAMVEVLPFKAPGGSLMETVDDGWVAPLSPWARPGEEYVGSLFRVEREPLRALLTSTDEKDLAARVDRFYRAWWKAQTDEPMAEKFAAWRQRMDQQGGADVQRFLRAWTEWRVVATLAAQNRLATGLIFSD